jgi:hypothetical protein
LLRGDLLLGRGLEIGIRAAHSAADQLKPQELVFGERQSRIVGSQVVAVAGASRLELVKGPIFVDSQARIHGVVRNVCEIFFDDDIKVHAGDQDDAFVPLDLDSAVHGGYREFGQVLFDLEFLVRFRKFGIFSDDVISLVHLLRAIK